MFPNHINGRMKLLIEGKLPKYGRFQELERLTTIKSTTWQTWARGRQRPTDRMIEAVACLWPEHAYWLVTGDELPLEGMPSPISELSREQKTLVEFTARTLAMRLTIRNELTAHLANLGVGVEEGNDEQVTVAVDAFMHRLNHLSQVGEDVHKIDDDQYWEKQWRMLMQNDEQLRELELTRRRLILQNFVKLAPDPSNPLPKK
jgi:hypothetical protein